MSNHHRLRIGRILTSMLIMVTVSFSTMLTLSIFLLLASLTSAISGFALALVFFLIRLEIRDLIKANKDLNSFEDLETLG